MVVGIVILSKFLYVSNCGTSTCFNDISCYQMKKKNCCMQNID